MCGIFGYIGPRNAFQTIIQGLERLEYRGYDSVGVALRDQNCITCAKQSGSIKTFKEQVQPFVGEAGIGHTRWATHGAPSSVNAHPHASCKEDIWLVHNGIVENYAALKAFLVQNGHRFSSQTDTEVLAHLVEHYYRGDLLAAVRQALAMVEGTYGVAVMSSRHPAMVAARKGSPLLLGIGDAEYFVSSDLTAIAPFTKQYVVLEDGQLAVISKEGCVLTNLQEETIDLHPESISWDIAQIEKQGYPHFMLKEIMEQPESIRNCLRGRLPADLEYPKLSLELQDADLQRIRRIILLGCGTSWHAGLIGEYVLESLLRIPVEVEYASEFRYREPVLHPDDLVIAISQSGETADTLEALKKAKDKVQIMSIVNAVGSTIAREAGSGIYIHAGPEIGVASTKAFTGQLTAIYLLGLFLARKLNKISVQEYHRMRTALQAMPDLIQDVLQQGQNIQAIAKDYASVRNFLYLGRGINYPVALEGALKLKEISYIHAEGYPAAEMKHGPIALIDEDMPVVVIAHPDDHYPKVISNIEEVKARGGKVIVIATQGDKTISSLGDRVFYVPHVEAWLSPLLHVIPLQLLAYHVAVLKGLNPDKPRNLAKSVTVE